MNQNDYSELDNFPATILVSFCFSFSLDYLIILINWKNVDYLVYKVLAGNIACIQRNVTTNRPITIVTREHELAYHN